MHKTTALALLMIGCLTGSVHAQDEAKLKALDGFAARALKDYSVPGMALAVVHNDRLVLVKGYGVRELGKEGDVDGDTIFQLASVTKSFTADAIGMLVDEGKVDFDEPVRTYLPDLVMHDPYATRFVTCRDLLAHRSGLPAFTGDILPDLGYNRKHVLERVRYFKPACTFRAEGNYSNVGYFIVGEVVARVSGQKWEDFVTARLLLPLNMKRSDPLYNGVQERDNVAQPYAGPEGKLRKVAFHDHDVLGAAGSISASASDTAQWMRMHLARGKYDGKQLLKAATIKDTYRPVTAIEPTFAEAAPSDAGSGLAFAMGWNNYHYEGYQIIEKGGGLAGMRSVVTLVPELDIGIVVLANRNLTFAPEAVRAEFLTLFVRKSRRDLQQLIREQGKKIDEILFRTEPPLKDPQPPLVPLARFAGDYTNELYGTLSIRVKGDQLVLHAGPARYAGTLTHRSNNTWRLKWPEVNSAADEVTFTIGADGQASRLDTDDLGSFVRKAK
ncbi:MAG: serine hydrolase [Gemmataceae bacterium]